MNKVILEELKNPQRYQHKERSMEISQLGVIPLFSPGVFVSIGYFSLTLTKNLNDIA